MKKKLLLIASSIFLILLTSISASSQVITTETHEIEISTSNDCLSVKEDFTIIGDEDGIYDNLTFWIPVGASEITISINNVQIGAPTQTGSVKFAVSDFNININESNSVSIGYKLSKDIEEFSRTIFRDTTSLAVSVDEKQIYSASNLAAGSSFTISLQPTETSLSWYIIIFIVLLVLLLVISMMYSFRKQKSTRIKETTGASEELLTTKKALLMELLKDVEKQHRAKQISDDTYHKIKEQYKQEAVETMKQLEDMKSKVK